ncbi:hypothetical protein [Insulibacter thermoxylanivorax]|uniref:hypothetical protein n=1 Tax=Insulibacter thermoxylanivorax TaxID=2749268 RepID=UPI00280A6B95|nr:hypothetical protein [Insulibacter thermoxylanivorax]
MPRIFNEHGPSAILLQQFSGGWLQHIGAGGSVQALRRLLHHRAGGLSLVHAAEYQDAE